MKHRVQKEDIRTEGELGGEKIDGLDQHFVFFVLTVKSAGKEERESGGYTSILN